ncbi:putative malate dehydrogenase 1B [Athalia rosae]|uniref:putative malate dehydrogenase 1B n=1 Tax=Athalia rosae TaxID=37344 RepID=UPI002033CE66|nr:putative malate dehydrogenase 1B [Athalia rosae]
MRTANAVYMGGATQFWKFIHEYYGIRSELSQDELQALGQDFVQETEAGREKNVSKATQKNEYIAILGSDVSLCQTLTAELFLLEKLYQAKIMIVKLYDTSSSNPKLKRQGDLSDTVTKGLRTPIIVQKIETALINCTVLILLDEIPRMEEETTENWLKRNRSIMLELAADINKFAPAEMKVIFCSTGPSCFNAGILATAAPKLDAHNIVAVALSEGIENLRETLDSVGFPLTEIGHPPVWGFSAINHFVDFCNIVQRHEIYRPNNRAIKAHKGTTLPLGVKQPDLRSMFYLLHEKSSLVNNPTFEVIKVNDSQKCKAICDLLRLWYSDSSNDGEIISLGVRSNGTFGIPSGIYFVQPVCLKKRKNKSYVWVPHTHFPVPNHTRCILGSMINGAKILLDKLVLQPVENTQ